MAGLAGKWKLETSDNFDEYMKALGVGLMMRKAGNLSKPVQEISVDGDNWIIKTTSTFKSSELKFTIGKPFEETTVDGRTVMTTVSLDGDVLTQDQKGSPNSILTRQIKDGNMEMVLKTGDVTCKRVYRRDG